MFCFTCNHQCWLHVKYNTEIISKLFQCFISHVTTSETEMKLFQPLKEFWNYFEIISATLNTLENIHELRPASQIVSGKFLHTEIKLFQTNADEGCKNLVIILFHVFNGMLEFWSKIMQIRKSALKAHSRIMYCHPHKCHAWNIAIATELKIEEYKGYIPRGHRETSRCQSARLMRASHRTLWRSLQVATEQTAWTPAVPSSAATSTINKQLQRLA